MLYKGSKIVNKRTGQQMIFLKTWAETNGTQLQIECFSPPAAAREPEHIHPRQENRFHIISGKLLFLINGKEITAGPGETISVPKNTPHCFCNPFTDDAHYIQEFYPALKTDRLFETFFELAERDKLDHKGAPNIFRTAQLMLFFKNEIRISKPAWFIQKIIFSLLSPISFVLGYRNKY